MAPLQSFLSFLCDYYKCCNAGKFYFSKFMPHTFYNFKKTEDTSSTAINMKSGKMSKTNEFNSNFFAKMFAFYVVPIFYILFTVSYLIYYLILSDY